MQLGCGVPGFLAGRHPASPRRAFLGGPCALIGSRGAGCFRSGRGLATSVVAQAFHGRSFSDPHRILGVEPGADERTIKRAHRKLVLRYHPDVGGKGGGDAAAEAQFMAIQEAYEVLMGRRRGKELDASENGNSWSFHDWYWRFSMSKRWGRGKKSGPNPFASATPPPGTQWRSQLDGLKRKAAAKRVKQRPGSAKPGAEWTPPVPAAGQAWAGAPRAAAHDAQRPPAQQKEQEAPQVQQQPAAQAEAHRASRRQARAVSRRAEQQQQQQEAARSQAKATASVEMPLSHLQQDEPEQQLHHEQQRVPLHHSPAVAAGAVASEAAAEPAMELHAPPEPEPLHHHFQSHYHHQQKGQGMGHSLGHSQPGAGEGAPSHADTQHHYHHQQQQQQHHHHRPLQRHSLEQEVLGAIGRLMGRVQNLSGGSLQNHAVALVRRASQLGEHLQVQLLRLRTLSTAHQPGAAASAVADHHTHSHTRTQLHVEFEETVRLRGWSPAGAGHSQAGGAGWDSAATAAAGAHTASANGRVAAEGGEPQAEHHSQQQQQQWEEQRAPKFVNDSHVRERVSSQLAGLRRRAAIRQEFSTDCPSADE